MNVCPGNPDNHFVEMITAKMVTAKKGPLQKKDGQCASFVDDYASVCLNGEMFEEQVIVNQHVQM